MVRMLSSLNLDTVKELEWNSIKANLSARQLGCRESTVQAQPAAKDLRCDGADNAVPQLDMSRSIRQEAGQWRCAMEMSTYTLGV